jgi:hypothetical protein
MRIHDGHTRSIHFDDGELPPVMWTRFNHKRIRLQPTSLVIQWSTDPDSGEWILRRVSAYGPRVHKVAKWSLSHVFYEQSQRETVIDNDIPDWVLHHVALSYPMFSTMAYTAVIEAVSILLGIVSPST